MEETTYVSQVVQDILDERTVRTAKRAAATEARDHEVATVVFMLVILGLIILLGMAVGSSITIDEVI